jgi:phage tail sheath protein FI
MATYLRPGVFVEETLTPLNDTNTSNSDSLAAFVGTSSRGGPIGPTLVTSWTHYQQLFGNIRDTQTNDLGYGVYSFFQNGGSRCYVVRAVSSDATAATVTLDDGAAEDPVDILTVTAKSPGVWANNSSPNPGVFVQVTDVSAGRFNLEVTVGSGANLVARENFVDLSMNPNDGRNAVTIINSPTAARTAAFVPDENTTAVALSGGTDGAAAVDYAAATELLSEVPNNLVLNLPGVTDTTVLNSVTAWAAETGRVFVVIDGPEPAVGDVNTDVAGDLAVQVSALTVTSHAAVYGPWLFIQDPASSVSGALRLTAPGGAVVGQYIRNDVARNVAKAPAGTGTALRGVLNTYVKFTDAQLDTLNQAHVNVIRNVPGAGVCIMGARSLSKGYPDRYINVRRTLMLLKADLVALTNFAVFEPNSHTLWQTIESVVDGYLNNQFGAGMFAGSTPDQAYFVQCDAEINTPASINSGVVNIRVGVALQNPAEFVVIHLGQFDGGSNVEDSLEA